MRVDFDRRLKLEFHGSKITSDAGLLAYRELDDVLGLTEIAGAALSDLRRGKNTRHLLTGLLRQSVYGRLAGYENVNDAERSSRDPASLEGLSGGVDSYFIAGLRAIRLEMSSSRETTSTATV